MYGTITPKPERKVITLRLNETLHQQIHRIAETNGETLNSVVRGLVRAGLERRQAVAGQ